MSIVYARETTLSVADYTAVVGGSALGPTRPIGDPDRIARMLAGANFVVTARDGGSCVGLARCMTDFSWVCYCAELAVRDTHQGLGIGSEIVRKCRDLLGDEVAFNLFATPDAAPWYQGMGDRLGFHRHADAFSIRRVRGV